jgi:cytochrome P450
MTSTQIAKEKMSADDPRYREMFDVERDAKKSGIQVESEYTEERNRLRETAPVQKGSLRSLLGLPEVAGSVLVERENYTFLSFHACERAFQENLLFSSEIMKESAGMQRVGPTILQMIGDEHRRNRAVVQPLFVRPRVINWWRKRWIDETVTTLLDRLGGRATTDLNLELCARLPMYVVTRGIGLEGEDALNFREHLTRSTFGARYEKPESVEASRVEVDRILQELIVQRRAASGDDIISIVLANQLALPDGGARKLTDQEIFSFCKLVMFAGGGTTWRQLGITIHALLTHYHFWEECLADRSLIEAAINEALRWRATDPVFWRLATADAEVEGVLVPKGARVNICLGAANRDPKIWDRPDEYDIHRANHHNLGTGLGPHRCLGREVAIQEMAAAINGLMDRWPRLRLDPEQPPPVYMGLEHRGMSALPVLLRTAD